MEFLPRQFMFGVCAVVLAIGLADAAHGETAPVVVGLARCSDCTRRNMNAEAAFKGLQVVVKCKSSKGEYERKAVGQLDKSGAFSVPLAADLVGVDGELKQDCLAQLHSAWNMPCPGQEPSKIVAAPSHGGKTAFMAIAGKVHEPSAECASAFLCHPPMIKPPKHDHDHPHLPGIKPPKHDHDHPHLPGKPIPPKHDHDHDHDLPPAGKPIPPKHDHDHDHDLPPAGKPIPPKHDHDHDHDLPPAGKPIPPKHDHDHDHDLPPAGKPIPPKHDHDHDHALPPVAMPPKPTPIYGPPSEHSAVTDPQLFKKMLPFLKKLPFFPPAEQNTMP